MPISEEHMCLLKKQNDLIQRLKCVISSQNQALEQLGVADAHEDEETREAEGYDSGCEAEKQRLLQDSAKACRRKKEPKITDEEREIPNVDSSTEPAGDEEEERNFMSTKPWLGAMAAPSNWSWDESKARDVAPCVKLELEYVHGYRGRTCRNNIAYLGDGKIMYPVAAVVVIHCVANKTQEYFRGHDDDILCLDLHSASSLVATGQQGADPPFFVWNALAPSEPEVAKFNCHKRAVVALAFSLDGNKIASVGLDDEHTVCVSCLQTKTTLSCLKGGPNPILHVQFNRTTGADGNNEFVTVGEKSIMFWTLGGNSLKSKKGLLGRKGEYQTFTCVAFTPEMTMVACAGGQVYGFVQNKLKKILSAHNGATYALDFCSESHLITGGRDGYLNVWDENTKKNIITIDLNKEDPCKGLNSIRAIYVNNKNPNVAIVGTITSSIYEVNLGTGSVQTLMQGHFGELYKSTGYGELWGLATHPTLPYYATAAEDNSLRVWNVESRVQVARSDIGKDGVCISWSNSGNFIAVGLINGAFSIHRFCEGGECSLVEITSMRKTRKRIQSIRFSPCEKYLAVGASDSIAYLYKIEGDECKLEHKLRGNSSTILHIDFSSDSKYIQTCSQAYEILYYETENGNQFTASRDLKDVEWSTFTSKLGWSVQGIWPKHSDGSDINMVGKSRCGGLLATAEDSGLVKVFNYPCVGSGLDRTGKLRRRPDSIQGVGHSEHVTGVEFSHGDTHVISTGGADLAIFQWKICKE